MNQLKKLIDEMYSGNAEAILSGISSESDYIVMNAILTGAKRGMTEKQFLDGLAKAQESKTVLMGFPLASVATAAAHFLKKIKYTGNDEIIKTLIENKFTI